MEIEDGTVLFEEEEVSNSLSTVQPSRPACVTDSHSTFSSPPTSINSNDYKKILSTHRNVFPALEIDLLRSLQKIDANLITLAKCEFPYQEIKLNKELNSEFEIAKFSLREMKHLSKSMKSNNLLSFADELEFHEFDDFINEQRDKDKDKDKDEEKKRENGSKDRVKVEYGPKIRTYSAYIRYLEKYWKKLTREKKKEEKRQLEDEIIELDKEGNTGNGMRLNESPSSCCTREHLESTCPMFMKISTIIICSDLFLMFLIICLLLGIGGIIFFHWINPLVAKPTGGGVSPFVSNH